MLIQNLGGQTKSVMAFSKEAGCQLVRIGHRHHSLCHIRGDQFLNKNAVERNIILKYPQFELLEPFRFIFQLFLHVKCMLPCNIETKMNSISFRGIIKNLNALEQAFS